MPKIPTYDAPALSVRPDERGVDANLQAARRTAAFYNEAGDLISSGARAQAQAASDISGAVSHGAEAVAAFAKQQEDFAGHREIVAGSKAASTLNLDLQNQWDALVKQPGAENDPTIAAKYREQVLEPALQKFSESYSNTDRGQQWAEAHVASMRNHFYQKTAADMSTLAGEAVKTSAREVINTNTNAAFKSPDFHTVDYLLDQTTASVTGIVGSSPNVKGADSARLRTEVTEKAKEQIVKAAAQGAIMKARDPEAVAQAFADRYPNYINGAEAKQLAVAAKTQAKTNLLQDRQAFTLQKQMDDYKAHQAASRVMADNVSVGPDGKIAIKPEYFSQALDIARQFPNAPSAATIAHTAITWGEHQQNQRAQPTVSDPQAKADLYTRIFDPTNPTSEVDLMKANVEGKLSTHDFTALHQLQKSVQNSDLKTEAFKDTLAAAKASLTYSMPGIPGKDPKGLESYARFVQDFIPKYEAAKRGGTLPPNALDFNDPKSMISQTMAAYKRTPQQLLNDRISEMSSINLTGDGKTVTGVQVIDIPAGMSPAEALKTYGKGKTIRLPDGRTKVLQ